MESCHGRLGLRLLALLAIAVLPTAAHAALTADYRFQGSLASSAGAPPALGNIGAGNAFAAGTVDGANRLVLTFPANNGLSLSPTTGVIPSGTYTIVLLFRFAAVDDFRKIADFKNGVSDSGLYVRDGNLYFYPQESGSGAPIAAGAYVQVALTRDGSGKVVGYVDGTQAFSFTDTQAEAVIGPLSTLRFFRDDDDTDDEESAGAVARIRLFDTALSASAIAALDRLPSAVFADNLVWAKRAGGTGDDLTSGSGIAVDSSGNSHVAGGFYGSATFGQPDANQIALFSEGMGDVFVAKYDSTGALLWAKRAGGASEDLGTGIAIDGSGHSYVTGSFRGTATFGQGEANQATLSSPGGADALFVAKYDSTGTFLWARRTGGTSIAGSGIAADRLGNSHVVGRFAGSATFGQDEANHTTLTSGGSTDTFLAKYASNGTLLWANRAGGTSADRGDGVAIDGAGHSHVIGSYIGSATFGQGEAHETTLTSAGDGNIFVATYDSTGALLWAKRAGGPGDDFGFGISVDGARNSYVTGRFQGTATFGPGEANQTALTSAGDVDIFVAKYDSTGALLWAKRAGGSGEDVGFGISVDGARNSYVTGYIDGAATFAPGEANQATLVPTGDIATFVAKYDLNGALVWAKRAGGPGSHIGVAIAVDSSHDSVVTGRFEGTATFGPGEANQTGLTAAGSEDAFIARFSSGLSPSGPLVAAVLPSSRAVQVGAAATAFATIINAGTTPAVDCGPSLPSGVPATFGYQTTNPGTNQVTGTPNTSVNIAAGSSQTYVFSLGPTGPIASTDVPLGFDCANTDPAAITPGVNTLQFLASASPVPDIVMLSATPPPDPGIVNIPGANGTGFFVVATVNVGVSGSITLSANTGGVTLPVILTMCETNPVTGVCLAPPSGSVTTTIGAGATPTFAVFVQGTGNIAFDPGTNGVRVEARDGSDNLVGGTRVAVRTQ